MADRKQRHGFDLGPAGATLSIDYELERRSERIPRVASGAFVVLLGSMGLVLRERDGGWVVSALLLVFGLFLLVRFTPRRGRISLGGSHLELGPVGRTRSLAIASVERIDLIEQRSWWGSLLGDRHLVLVVRDGASDTLESGLAVAKLDEQVARELATRISLRRDALAAGHPRALFAFEARHEAGPEAIGIVLGGDDEARAVYSARELQEVADGAPYRSGPKLLACIQANAWDLLVATNPSTASRIEPLLLSR